MENQRKSFIIDAAVSVLSGCYPGLTPMQLETALDSPTKTEAEKDWLLTCDEAAKALAVSRSTLGRMLRSGELKRVRIRGLVRIAQSDIDQMIAGGKDA